ncbi:MAG: TRAP transporter small permease [Caldimonas sp.]
MASPEARGEPRVLRRLSALSRTLTAFAIGVSASGVLVSLALIGWSVVMRYLFNRPPVWVDDAVGFLLVAIVMFGAADTLRRGEHIGVDLFTQRLAPGAARLAQIGATLAVMLVALILVLNGWQTAMQSRQFGVVTEGQIEWPVWWLMLLLPAGGLMMAVVTIEMLWRLLLGLPTAPSHVQGTGE